MLGISVKEISSISSYIFPVLEFLNFGDLRVEFLIKGTFKWFLQ